MYASLYLHIWIPHSGKLWLALNLVKEAEIMSYVQAPMGTCLEHYTVGRVLIARFFWLQITVFPSLTIKRIAGKRICNEKLLHITMPLLLVEHLSARASLHIIIISHILTQPLRLRWVFINTWSHLPTPSHVQLLPNTKGPGATPLAI